MDEGQPFSFMKHFNRPNSLKLELLTLPEHSARNSFVQDISVEEHIGFRDVSYSIKEGLFKRSELFL